MTRKARSTSYAPGELLGSTTPRLATPPLVDGPPGGCPCGCALSPETSFGFDVIDFARDVLGTPLDPWEELAAIHLGELLPDGRPRFRVILILVARQNGKTLLAKVLILYWMFVEQVPLVGGTSTDRSYAKRTWSQVCGTAGDNPWLKRRLGPKWLRLTIGEEAATTLDGSEYVFAANNHRAFRSTTLSRWLCDELREHASWECWDSASNAQNAVRDAQIVAVTNQGGAESVVLDSLRNAALTYIETGAGDPRMGLLEWSAPDGAEPDDIPSLAQANPNLGRRIDVDALLGAALRAKAAGGEELTGFRTEVMCQKVTLLNPAISPEAWDAAGTDTPLDLAEHRDRVALCFDVSLDGTHATLAAAALIEGKIHVEVVRAWEGQGCTKQLRADLPGIVAKVKPRVLAWFPSGPSAAVAADLADRGHRGWPPRRVKIEEIKSETTAVCMGAADVILAGEIVQPRDDMLTAHINATQPLRRGDGWVFGRRDAAGPIDGAYALAGAVHLARTLPPPLSPVQVL